jgi:hypothetical protein
LAQNGAPRRSSNQPTPSRQPGEPPTVHAFRTSDGVQLAFWCDWCCTLHHHGAVGDSTGAGDGHRVAHCVNPRSPYLARGYYVKEASRVYWVMVP